MATEKKIRDEKLHYYANSEAKTYQHYNKTQLISMNILEMNKCYLLIKVEQQNR